MFVKIVSNGESLYINPAYVALVETYFDVNEQITVDSMTNVVFCTGDRRVINIPLEEMMGYLGGK